MHTIHFRSTDDDPLPIKIGTHEINAYGEPYIIAEAGVNHDGRLDQAKRLVDAAQQAGAHAVKFQVFQAKTLVREGTPTANYQTSAGGGASQREMLQNLELTPEDFQELRRHCQQRDIAFLATPFTIEDLEVILDLGVPAIKIASTDLNNFPLLDAVTTTNNLPILLSTGASHLSEIDEAVSQFDLNEACDRLILLHCVSSYPTAPQEAALSSIACLRQRYTLWTGYSDHTECIETAGLAVACGAKVLEKHLTLDRSLKGPDHAFSLTPDMFRSYLESAQNAWRMLGEPRRGVVESEAEVRTLSRKSVVAKVAIHKGQVISAEVLTLKRPGDGIEPRHLPSLIGKCAAKDIPVDTQIDWNMVN